MQTPGPNTLLSLPAVDFPPKQVSRPAWPISSGVGGVLFNRKSHTTLLNSSGHLFIGQVADPVEHNQGTVLQPALQLQRRGGIHGAVARAPEQ